MFYNSYVSLLLFISFFVTLLLIVKLDKAHTQIDKWVSVPVYLYLKFIAVFIAVSAAAAADAVNTATFIVTTSIDRPTDRPIDRSIQQTEQRLLILFNTHQCTWQKIIIKKNTKILIWKKKHIFLACFRLLCPFITPQFDLIRPSALVCAFVFHEFIILSRDSCYTHV